MRISDWSSDVCSSDLAQKRVESVQDVPIAVTALSQKALEEQKIEGGPDIMRAVPNLTFSKSNFTGYNLSIRGVGTKSISATSDPGVAIAFNNSAMIHNRRSEEHTSELQSLMRISYAVFCLKKKTPQNT